MRRWALAAALALLAQAGAYTVQRGDTLYRIAHQHGLSVQTLMQLNGLRSTVIEPGQQLRTASAAATTPASQPAESSAVFQRGYAVYYGGRRDPQTRMTAAHLTLPFGTWVQVTHTRTGRRVTVKVNDRGPFNGGGRVIDLSTTAARSLGILSEGVAPVTLRILTRS